VTRHRCLSIGWAISIFLATGCQDPSAPFVVPSSYAMRSVDGASVPATLFHGGATEVALLADTIHLYPLGVAQRSTISRYTTSPVRALS
jgi:hypothetical protein